MTYNLRLKKSAKIFVAGHLGLVGSAITKNLQSKGYHNLILKTHQQLDLTEQVAVREFFIKQKPEYVILAAAKVGGIEANNTYRADFIYQNLVIQSNVIHQSYLSGVKKLLFLGSTCIYPKNCQQPMREDSLLSSELEYTNEPYAIAKIAGLKMCESYNLEYGTNFIALMPTNLYGPNDNFNLHTAHVIPALISKIHQAKINNYNTVEIWGSGKPRREFLYSEDMADACVFVLENVNFNDLCKGKKEIRNTHINIGTGIDISIKELAQMISKIIGFEGELFFNIKKPDGTMVKLTDSTKLHQLGWRHKTDLAAGINKLYNYYKNNR